MVPEKNPDTLMTALIIFTIIAAIIFPLYFCEFAGFTRERVTEYVKALVLILPFYGIICWMLLGDEEVDE